MLIQVSTPAVVFPIDHLTGTLPHVCIHSKTHCWDILKYMYSYLQALTHSQVFKIISCKLQSTFSPTFECSYVHKKCHELRHPIKRSILNTERFVLLSLLLESTYELYRLLQYMTVLHFYNL